MREDNPVPTTKPWRCSAGHVLGLVESKSRLHQLNLYSQAVQDGEEGSVVAQLSGPADVTCSVCGRTREWLATEESLLDLLMRVKYLHSKRP